MLEQTSQEIIKTVDHLQNGDISIAMERMGIRYGTNYGVSIPQLQKIAAKYDKNNPLAFYLFDKPIREAKIIASMLFDVKEIRAQQLVILSSRLNNIELIEQYSKNLFSKLEDLKEILNLLIKGHDWQKALALYSVAWKIRSSKIIQAEIIDWAVVQLQLIKGEENSSLQKSYVFLLQSIAGINSDYKKQIVEISKDMSRGNNVSAAQIANEFLLIY